MDTEKDKQKEEDTPKEVSKDKPVGSEKTAKKPKNKLKLVLIIGVVLAVLCIVCSLVMILLFTSAGGSFHERGEEYELDYNYSALDIPPWIEDEEHQDIFSSIAQKLRDAGIVIGGNFFRDVAEDDLSSLYDDLEAEALGDSGAEAVPVVDDPYSNLDLDNVIYDPDYYYLFEVLNADLISISETVGTDLNEPYPIVTYCHLLSEPPEYPSDFCSDSDSIPVFVVSVFTEDQYSEYLEGVMVTGELLADDGEVYLVGDFPNGDLPEEVRFPELYQLITDTFMLEF